MTAIDPPPYHRKPDEPHLWFQRFEHFMHLGSARSVSRTYRELINQQRARDGRPPLTSSASCPAVWRQRARQFNWDDRAEAWDRYQKRQERAKIERVRTMARDLSPQAIRTLESTMLGQLRDPDGTLTPGQNCAQRRLAAEKILDLVGVGVVETDDDYDDDHIFEIRGITIVHPDSPEGIAHDQEIRRQVNARYPGLPGAGHPETPEGPGTS